MNYEIDLERLEIERRYIAAKFIAEQITTAHNINELEKISKIRDYYIIETGRLTIRSVINDRTQDSKY